MKPTFVYPVRFWGLFVYILFIAFISLWQRDQMHRMGYAIHDIERLKAERATLHKELLIKVEHLNAMDRIEHVATTQLLMVPALPEERVYVKRKSASRSNP